MKNILIIPVLLLLFSCNRDKVLESNLAKYYTENMVFSVIKDDYIKVTSDSVCINFKCKQADLLCRIDCHDCKVPYKKDSTQYYAIVKNTKLIELRIQNSKNLVIYKK